MKTLHPHQAECFRISHAPRLHATGDLALDAGVDHRREHHLSTRSSGAFIEKLRVDETLSESVLAHPTHIAASQVQLVAGGDLDLYASQLVSREAAASLVAGGEVNLWAVEEQHYTLERHETSTNFLGWIPLERQAVSDSVFETGARVAHLQSEGAPTLAGGGDIRLQGTVIDSPAAPVITPGVGPQAKADAQLILEGVITRTVTEHHEEDTNIAWQRLAGHGETVETLTLPQIQAGLSGVRAPGGIVAQIPEGDLNTHISQLSQQPGTAWVGELAAIGATDPVLWQPVALAYETWAYEQEGLSPAASAIIAVAVAIGTQGMGADLLYQATGVATTTGTSFTLVGVMANAGFSTLVGQASIAFVNNKGDIGATLKALGSSGNVRSLVTSIVTAGMTNAALFTDAAGHAASLNDLAGLTDLPGMGTKLASLELANLNLGDLARGVGGRALVNAGVSHLVQGVDLGDALRLGLSADLGALGASGIGSLWGAGKDPVLQTFAHAVLGCGAASLAGNDCAAGAVGGATESVLGNVLDVELGANGQYDKRTQFLYTAGAILSASLVADGLGLDTSTAIGAAQNAAVNNRMLHPHEKELAKQLHKQAQEEGLPYSLEEIEDALRWAANDALGEGVVSAPTIIDANTSADAVYDVDTLKLYNPNPGVSQPVLYQDMNAIAPPSEGLINFVQGHTGSTYSWNPTLWQAQAPTSAQHGADQRYAGFVADGKLFSLPVVDCPASSCANESSIAWFSDNPADQVNLAAFAVAVDTDIARGVLTIGSSALIPASGLATGLAGEVTLGAGLGGLFDLAGQWYGGNEFKAWQTVTSMTTGAAAYPLGSSSSLYNGILGGTVGAINTQTTNLIYDDEASVISAFGTGFLFSGGASILANWTSKALAGVLPTHLDGNPHNPSVAILLQNVGQPNPYPEYAGFIIDQTVSNMPSFLSGTEAVQEP